ncbi:MAG: flagellar motor protein MotB [Planctomycetota bacterium]
MGRSKKEAEPDEPPGAPEWMVTFSDCMTLLLTFFVLLLSFSSFDDNVFKKLKIIFADALPSVNPLTKREVKDAFLPTEQIRTTEEVDRGSEKPTLESGKQDTSREDTEPVDFHSRKVFLIPSKEAFWGKGTVISFQGRRILSNMASFLKEVPGRVVISENGREDDKDSKRFGLPRAWTVLDYLTTRQGLDKKRFSISAISTLAPKSFTNTKTGRERQEPERLLEIVILERSLYN